jgi:predicted acylesterase/phospholipase RssA
MKKLIVGGLVVALLAVIGLWLKSITEYPARLPAVPEDRSTQAVIPGIPDARYLIGFETVGFVQSVLAARQREYDFRAQSGQTGDLPPADLLALSGGGDNGAFGAGLLNGWTAAGNRPTFKAVTGISTGALLAPFAYLGPDYDHVLREVFTTTSPKDVLARRSVLAAIENDGMADNRPLWGLISKYVDQEMLDAVAAEYAKGRLLLIGTTNIDAGIPVMWNMGAIAESGAPVALELFRSILLASAAIPGAFPPTMVRVEVDGQPYDEMHVDGGASTQVFLYPPSMPAVARTLGVEMTVRSGRVFVIRNASLRPTWKPVNRRTIDIAGRAIGTLIQTQGFGDLYRIYATCQRDGFEFNLAYIGADFNAEKTEDFDTAFMNALFDYGYRLGSEGYSWKKVPAGWDTPYMERGDDAESPE